MSAGDHARLAAATTARATLAAGGHAITPRLHRIFPGDPRLETWTGHCERCGESFSLRFVDGGWKAEGMVYVWATACRGEWRSYYHEEEEDGFDDE